MKRESIEKVVEKAVECNFISLEDCSLSKDERKQEIIEVIERDIDEENKKAIKALINDFGDFIMNAKSVTTFDEVTGEQRSLTANEVVDIIQCEYFGIQELMDEILSE